MLIILATAGAAALASVVGGLLALWRQPTTLFMSLILGFTSGVLIATISFEMLPQALALGSLAVVAAGFAAGFSTIYAWDLFVHRGAIAGEQAEQHTQVERLYRRRRPIGDESTVLAGGTSFEELVEGLTIGAGAAIEPRLAILIAIAIAIDNLSEGLSIGEFIRGEAEATGKGYVRRVLGWTGLIGVALLGSALVGGLLLRGLALPILAFLFAFGGGGMLYLTVTDLVPSAQARHYQQSSALATAAGFLVILILTEFI